MGNEIVNFSCRFPLVISSKPTCFYYLCMDIINVNMLGLSFLLSVQEYHQCQHAWLVVFIICAWMLSMSTRLACCFYYLYMDIINVNTLKACRFYYLCMDIINVNTFGLLFLLSVHGYHQCQHA